MDGTAEATMRLRAPELHGRGRRVVAAGGPLELAQGEVELRSAQGALEWRGAVLAAELDGGWSSTFALPDGGAPTPLAECFSAHGRTLTLEVDLAAAAALQTDAGREDPELASRALRALVAEGGIEVTGPNLRAKGQAARRDPGSAVTWLTGDPAQVQRGGLSYRGRRLELELR
ncbi:MAG: hypothetical protein KDD82_23645 [Planctomycetes bacterium]|nr:hypothetical protein [Planctomycetota bacterium]